MFINSLFLGTITGYDAPDAPSRIKRHDISRFPVPIINPTSKPNFGGWSLPWFPVDVTSSQQGKQDLVDDFEPVKIIKSYNVFD